MLETNDQLGSCVRVLASSRGGGVFLCCGDDSMDAAGWIIDALDMSGRLVVHRNSIDKLEAIRECFNTDLRISVHAQNLTEFLDDIKKHRFELVVLGASMCTIPNVERISTVLGDGGFMLLSGFEHEAALFEFKGHEGFVFTTHDHVGTIAVRRRSNSHPRRRGGRRRNDDG